MIIMYELANCSLSDVTDYELRDDRRSSLPLMRARGERWCPERAALPTNNLSVSTVVIVLKV